MGICRPDNDVVRIPNGPAKDEARPTRLYGVANANELKALSECRWVDHLDDDRRNRRNNARIGHSLGIRRTEYTGPHLVTGHDAHGSAGPTRHACFHTPSIWECPSHEERSSLGKRREWGIHPRRVRGGRLGEQRHASRGTSIYPRAPCRFCDVGIARDLNPAKQ